MSAVLPVYFPYIFSDIILAHRMALSLPIISKLDLARDEALGPRSERTRVKPTLDGNGFVGGIQFERSNRAVPIKNTRCYSMGIIHQKQKNLNAPSVGGKIEGGKWDDDLHRRKIMVQVIQINGFKERTYLNFLSYRPL
jgi:hypothetical protein